MLAPQLVQERVLARGLQLVLGLVPQLVRGPGLGWAPQREQAREQVPEQEQVQERVQERVG